MFQFWNLDLAFSMYLRADIMVLFFYLLLNDCFFTFKRLIVLVNYHLHFELLRVKDWIEIDLHVWCFAAVVIWSLQKSLKDLIFKTWGVILFIIVTHACLLFQFLFQNNKIWRFCQVHHNFSPFWTWWLIPSSYGKMMQVNLITFHSMQFLYHWILLLLFLLFSAALFANFKIGRVC